MVNPNNLTIKVENTSNETNDEVKESLRLIEDLKFFLATAPANWQENQVIRRYYLNHDEGFVSCVFWNNLYFITGTDIVRCIVYKFEHFGRKIIDRKKFEEGIFSDLRSLKCGTDAVLELPRSEFLEFLFKNSCLRTQKKQKVFFWFNVPHDKLMADALERDLKKEKAGQNPTTVAEREPALSFNFDESKSLYNQLMEHMEKLKKFNFSPLTSATEVKSSPEYITSALSREDENNLNDDTNSQQKSNSEYEDDFPLDYFESTSDYYNEQNSYISLDPNIQRAGNSMGDKYEPLLDPSIFIHPNVPIITTNQLVYSDEYLIEQTQPSSIKSQSLGAGAFKGGSQRYSNIPNDEYYQAIPLSAKFQPTFPRSVVTPLHQSFQQSQGYEISNRSYYQQSNESQSPLILRESDYWPLNNMDQMLLPSNQQYLLMNELDLMPSNMYQVMNPAMVNVVAHSPYAFNSYPKVSARQQLISANMMKKKRQMFQLHNKINSPVPNEKRQRLSQSLDEVINSRPSKMTNYGLNEEDSVNVLIPTPESSVAHTSVNSSRPNSKI